MNTYRPSDTVIKAWKEKDIEAFKQATYEDDLAMDSIGSSYYKYLKRNYGLWGEGFEYLCEFDFFESNEIIERYRREIQVNNA